MTHTNNSKFRTHTLATAVALILAASLAPLAAQAANGIAASATALRSGDVITGVLPSSRPIHVEVALKLRNRDQLDKFIAAAGRAMSHDQLMADHAPTAEQAQRVAAYLRQFGFTNVTIAPNRLLVSADGTADSAQKAFLASFKRVRSRDGRDTFANTSDVYIPGSLQDTVLSVVGLQDVHRPHLGLTTQAITGHNPTEFSSIYGATGVATAAGVTVGIITQGSLSQTITDLNTFTSNNGLPTVVTQTVNTNGTSTDTSGVGEWNLDSQDVVGMGGGQVGKIIFYNIPTLSNTNLTADINTVVTANASKIINVSLGECETDAQADGSAAAQDQSFKVAVAQGQTFSISTGDSGSNECGTGATAPSWPAASQYVIAAAGTTLSASTTTWSSETVWSGSGGSQSNFEPKPSWQTLWTGPRRGVADIAFDADPNSGSKVIVNGSIQQIGGTSLSAPLFSGMWARVIAVKGTTVGFAGPLIYALPASDFHDVVSGTNGGSTATTGYDLASGRGSIILSTAIGHIGGGGGTSSQLLGNTGFETGTASPWTTTSGVISNSTSEPAHGGSWDAWMDGYGSAHTDTVAQTVSIPSGKTSATLQYYLHIDTAETTTSSAYDTVKVQVYNTAGTLLATLGTFSNLNKNTGYAVHSSSLASYIGQTVVVKFTGTEDSSLQTSFVLDDVTLTVQ